jgi:phosphoribosylaminoimidazolecarboxamide formyltransferase/IMP cyclohydrolase
VTPEEKAELEAENAQLKQKLAAAEAEQKTAAAAKRHGDHLAYAEQLVGEGKLDGCYQGLGRARRFDPIASAHLRAHECDPVSAFGGVIAANRTVTLKMAENLRDIFTEVIVAPDFAPEALEVFALKKNLRVLQLPANWRQERMDVRLVSGGLLLQDADRFPEDLGEVSRDWQLVTGEQPTEAEMSNLVFAWKACRAVKSNAIVLAQASATVGIGMGQVNRVDSCRLAVERAGARAEGLVGRQKFGGGKRRGESDQSGE